MRNINEILDRLSKSNFRNSFHLNKKMKVYVNEKGLLSIKKHAYEIIQKRLALAVIINDGHQTPMKQVHPVFIAEHATATCCRSCLEKWHKIPKGRKLTNEEIDYIVNIIMTWIDNECKRGDGNERSNDNN